MGEIPEGSVALVAGMVVLCVLMLAAFAYAVRDQRVALGAVVWVGVVSGLAAAGLLAEWEPPRPFFVIGPTFAALMVVFRRKRSVLIQHSFMLIVGIQAFRIPVELIIHQAVAEGIAPPQMTWLPGMNQDVLTGIAALLLAPFANRLPRWALQAFNIGGLGLLLWVVGVAVLSMPTPMQQIEPDNIWIAFFPWVLLPVVLVSCAFLGHLTLFAKLAAEKQGSGS